jgi:hypothetical protein
MMSDALAPTDAAEADETDMPGQCLDNVPIGVLVEEGVGPLVTPPSSRRKTGRSTSPSSRTARYV